MGRYSLNVAVPGNPQITLHNHIDADNSDFALCPSGRPGDTDDLVIVQAANGKTEYLCADRAQAYLEPLGLWPLTGPWHQVTAQLSAMKTEQRIGRLEDPDCPASVRIGVLEELRDTWDSLTPALQQHALDAALPYLLHENQSVRLAVAQWVAPYSADPEVMNQLGQALLLTDSNDIRLQDIFLAIEQTPQCLTEAAEGALRAYYERVSGQDPQRRTLLRLLRQKGTGATATISLFEQTARQGTDPLAEEALAALQQTAPETWKAVLAARAVDPHPYIAARALAELAPLDPSKALSLFMTQGITRYSTRAKGLTNQMAPLMIAIETVVQRCRDPESWTEATRTAVAKELAHIFELDFAYDRSLTSIAISALDVMFRLDPATAVQYTAPFLNSANVESNGYRDYALMKGYTIGFRRLARIDRDHWSTTRIQIGQALAMMIVQKRGDSYYRATVARALCLSPHESFRDLIEQAIGDRTDWFGRSNSDLVDDLRGAIAKLDGKNARCATNELFEPLPTGE
ncbi:MAG: hypothetical protein HY696_09305 [Deltaproteobacteria bacterium]|nr:hypothetical protein [Deltaproteobacteria bacterium]